MVSVCLLLAAAGRAVASSTGGTDGSRVGLPFAHTGSALSSSLCLLRSLVVPAAVYAAGMLLWRQTVGQDPMPGVPAIAMLLDKWTLGPLRVLNFVSVFVLLVSFGPWLKQVLPRPLPLELLGRHSLSVFCAHIVIALFTLAFFGSTQVVRPWSTDVALLAGAFAGLFAVAMALEAQSRSGWRPVLRWRSGPQVR